MKNKISKTSKIYLNKFARYFGLQNKPSSGAERKKSVKHKRIVTNKGLKFKMRDSDWLLGLSYKCEICHWRASSRLFIPK